MSDRLIEDHRVEQLRAARGGREHPFDHEALMATLRSGIEAWSCDTRRRQEARAASLALLTATAPPAGEALTVTQWWQQHVDVPDATSTATSAVTSDAGVRALVMRRIVQPSWGRLVTARVERWVSVLPEADPLVEANRQLVDMREVHELPGTTFSNPAERGACDSRRCHGGTRPSRSCSRGWFCW